VCDTKIHNISVRECKEDYKNDISVVIVESYRKVFTWLSIAQENHRNQGYSTATDHKNHNLVAWLFECYSTFPSDIIKKVIKQETYNRSEEYI
jgi:hypothetical protein